LGSSLERILYVLFFLETGPWHAANTRQETMMTNMLFNLPITTQPLIKI